MAESEGSTSTATTAASATVTGLALIAVVLRFYVRIRFKAGLAWDDWWILVGLLLTLLTGGLLLWSNAVDPDGGKAAENESPDFDYSPHITYLKLSFISSIMYFSIITATKTSILLMYRRIFSIDKPFRLQSLLVLIIVFAFWLACTIATLTNCRPLEYSWIGLSLEEFCFNYNIFWMVTGAVEVVIDTTILALPVRMILGLQLSVRRKLSIIFIFLLGGFVIITGIIRVIYGYKPGSRVPSYSKAELWSTVHVGMAMVCACLPTLRPLIFRSSSSATSSRRRRYTYGLRKWYGKSEPSSNSTEGPGAEHALEAQPLRNNSDEFNVDLNSPQVRSPGLADRNKDLPPLPRGYEQIELGVRRT